MTSMEQEVRITLQLTLSVDAELSKTKIINLVKAGISIEELEGIKILKVEEEAEIYGNK